MSRRRRPRGVATGRQHSAKSKRIEFANRMLRFASLSYKKLRCGQRLGAGGRENGPRAASCDAEKTAVSERKRNDAQPRLTRCRAEQREFPQEVPQKRALTKRLRERQLKRLVSRGDRRGLARCRSAATRSTSESWRGRGCSCERRTGPQSFSGSKKKQQGRAAPRLRKGEAPKRAILPVCVCGRELVLQSAPARTRCSGSCGGQPLQESAPHGMRRSAMVLRAGERLPK